MVQSRSDFGFAEENLPPLRRVEMSLSGVYSFGPGVWLLLRITQSMSLFGLASDIFTAPPVPGLVRLSFITYWLGPGVSAARNISISVCVFGFAVLNLPPLGFDHRPVAEEG